MKKFLIASALILSTVFSYGQDQSKIVVNLRDNAKLQFKGRPVKMKACVFSFEPVVNATKDFRLVVVVKLYEDVAGAYGDLIVQTIAADSTLSVEERTHLLSAYADKYVTYTTANKFVDVSGNIVAEQTPGAIPEILYWQNFKLNQVAGMGTLANQGALDAQYLVIRAIITKLNARKNL